MFGSDPPNKFNNELLWALGDFGCKKKVTKKGMFGSVPHDRRQILPRTKYGLMKLNINFVKIGKWT